MRDRKKRRKEKCGERVRRGVNRVNRNVFDPGRQMLKKCCLFCVMAHLNWQVAIPRWLFVEKPGTNELIETRKKDGTDSGSGYEEGLEIWR